MTKKKIAVLGGGASALVAVWDLIHANPDAFDVTVYQVGWRLGGKGASGRDASGRIEEHGLHLMFGFYENVFRVIRQAYDEAYPQHADLWRDFLKTAQTGVAMIKFRDRGQLQWDPWTVPYPEENRETPGDGKVGGEAQVIIRILGNLLRWLAGSVRDALGGRNLFVEAVVPVEHLTLEQLRDGIDELMRTSSHDLDDRPKPPFAEIARVFFDKLVNQMTSALERSADAKRFQWLIDRTLELVESFRAHLPRGGADMIRFTGAVGKGVFIDLFAQGRSNWFALDEYDFREWLKRHGGDPTSPVVDGLYDAVFGSYSKLGAGSILQASTKAAFLFRGGAIFKMYAGMGDTIFTPLYQALKARGVKFAFFHRIENVTHSADGRSVDSIVLERQVEVSAGPLAYEPLVSLPVTIGPLRQLACWPSAPQWAQIEAADIARVRDKGVNLESHWTPSAPARQHTLRVGSDFDLVILGISVAALPEICPELLVEDPAFGLHVGELAPATTATQAIQLWWVHGRKPASPQPIVVPFGDPYDTVADMSHLLAAESWPANAVGGIHYLCSAIEEDSPPPPRNVLEYPDALRAAGHAQALWWVRDRAMVLWPELRTAGGTFDWTALHDPGGGVGAARLDAQWIHTPASLSDRYVLPVPQSNALRLRSNGTKFENLYLTGDWILTSLSIGCLEAAVMSGIQAARAIARECGVHEVQRAAGDWIDDVNNRRAPAVAALLRTTTPPPSYRKRSGEIVAPPPYEIDCPSLTMFVLRADAGRLQAMCDRELNLGSTRYAPMGPYAILYAASLSTSSSGVTCAANEVGFWVPLLATGPDGRRALRTYSPYVWLDSATSTMSGRAIYGYAKFTGEVDVPALRVGATGVDRTVAVRGDALVSGTGERLWTVSKETLLTARPVDATASNLGGLSSYIEVAGVLAEVMGEHATDLESLVRGMRSVFLKQLPEPSGIAPAYQRLVEATISPHFDTVRGAPFAGAWTVELPAHHEPAIVDMLGLAATQTFTPRMKRTSTLRPPLAQLWMTFQGRIEPGEVVWPGDRERFASVR